MIGRKRRHVAVSEESEEEEPEVKRQKTSAKQYMDSDEAYDENLF